jgi:hypothetical protein
MLPGINGLKPGIGKPASPLGLKPRILQKVARPQPRYFRTIRLNKVRAFGS